MLTMDDIESLRAKILEAKDLDEMHRFSYELMLNAPELLARAVAWELVAIQVRSGDSPTSVGWSATAAVIDFDNSAAKGFKP